MPVRLNITMEEAVYRRLKKEVRPKKISAFINAAVRARLYPDKETLDAAYRAARRESWRKSFPLHCAGALIEVAAGIFKRQEPHWPEKVAACIEEARNALSVYAFLR